MPLSQHFGRVPPSPGAARQCSKMRHHVNTLPVTLQYRTHPNDFKVPNIISSWILKVLRHLDNHITDTPNNFARDWMAMASFPLLFPLFLLAALIPMGTAAGSPPLDKCGPNAAFNQLWSKGVVGPFAGAEINSDIY